MAIDQEIFERLEAIDWFANCGKQLEFKLERFECNKSLNPTQAYKLSRTDRWQDFLGRMKDEMEDFLEQDHAELYDSLKKPLTAESLVFYDKALPAIIEKMNCRGLSMMTKKKPWFVIVNIIIEFVLRKQIPDLPVGFTDLFLVYERGHVPCGWDLEMTDWPEGRLWVY
ncbi:hypothetical protein ACFL4W_02285 [Planctomycetota bacterium]